MRRSSNMVNFFTSGGFRHALEPGVEQDGTLVDEHWYLAAGDSMYPIRPDIKTWLDTYMPDRYWIAGVGVSGSEVTTRRPIYFELESDLILFKLHWTNKTSSMWFRHVHY